jgi:hypothetical protein
MNTILCLSRKLYRGLVRLYPSDLRRHFGSEMVDVFEQQLLAAWGERGAAGVGRVWCLVVVEVAAGAAVPGLAQAAAIAAASILASLVLFLALVWAAGFARPCG